MTSNLDMAENSTVESETNHTFLQEASNYLTYKVAKYIAKYWFPLLTPLGSVVGNTLSFLVMIRSNNRKISIMYLHGSY